MIKLFTLIFYFVITTHLGIAQVNKTNTDVEQVWLGYFNQTRFSDKWGMWVDIQLRTKERFVDDLSVSLNRFGLTYYITDNTKITAGYSYIAAFAEGNRTVTLPEHRPWQQVQWHTKYGNKRMMQWFRLDERFRRKLKNESTLGDGHDFNFRLRYNFFYDIPLSRQGVAPNTFSFLINNEVHVNFGKQIVYNTFDQNRFFLGFKYQLTASDNIQLGYMHLYQQLASGNRYRTLHTARLGYFHNVDLRTRK